MPNGEDPPPSLHEHYTRFSATTRQSAPSRRIGTFGLVVGATCAFSLNIARLGSHVPYKSLVELHVACMPDAARAVSRTAPELFLGEPRDSQFRHRLCHFDTSSAIRLRS